MRMQFHTVDRESSGAWRMTFQVVTAALLGIAGMLTMVDLAQPSRAVAESASPAGSNAAAMLVYPSDTITYRVYLPLALNQYPTNSVMGAQFYGHLGPSTGLTHAIESRVHWLRFPVSWSDVEPVNTTPDNYQWADLDASVQAMWNTDINAVFTLGDNPAWAALKPGGPVTNTADLEEFVGAIVARYPSIRYWEIYNEPDALQRFGTKGSVYAATLASLYPVIKSANPSAQVVLGGLAMDWFIDQGGPFDRDFLRDVLASCSGACFDVANFHYYPYFRGHWETYGRDIIGKANFVRQTLAAYHFTRPLFATESNWPSASNWGSPELAARYVPKVYARSLAAGLSATMWYAMLDADSSNPGLLDSTTPGALTPRLSYQAYQVLTLRMSNAKYLGVSPVSDLLEGYQFSASGKRIDLYWYDCPLVKAPLYDGPRDCDDVAVLRIPASRVGVIDKLGAQVIKNDGDDGAADGKVTLNVGSSPIYIDYAP
jgi:hypothetical protein